MYLSFSAHACIPRHSHELSSKPTILTKKLNNISYEVGKRGNHKMGFFKEMFEDITGKSNRPEIKGSRFEKFVLDEIFIDKLFESVFNREWEYSGSVSFFPRYTLSELAKIEPILDFCKKGNEEQISMALKYQGNFYNTCNLIMPKFVKNQSQLTAWM